MLKKWRLIEIDLDTIDVNEDNPKTIDPKSFVALKESLETFGLVEPLVFNKRSGKIAGGNQRIKVLKSMGEKKVQAMEVDLDQDEERALMVVLSNSYAQGKWDIKKAIEQIDSIRDHTPNLYSALAIGPLRKDLVKDTQMTMEGPKDAIPEMEIMPFEHWDYIAIVFKDSRDWLAALEFLGVGKVKFTPAVGPKKVGLGRVIEGKTFLRKVGIET